MMSLLSLRDNAVFGGCLFVLQYAQVSLSASLSKAGEQVNCTVLGLQRLQVLEEKPPL